MKHCPLLKKACMEHQCAWYLHVIGQDPQTGAAMDEWGCAITWTPILAIEGSRSTRSVAAAVESMRNEVVQRQDALNTAVALAQRPQAPQLERDITGETDAMAGRRR